MPSIATKGGGAVQAMGNVEKMPPTMAPVPFPSMAQLTQFQPDTEKVKILNQPPVLQGGGSPSTNGDSPTGQGAVSNRSMGPAKVTNGACDKVLVEGKPVAVQGSTVSMNQSNAPMGKITSVAQSAVNCNG